MKILFLQLVSGCFLLKDKLSLTLGKYLVQARSEILDSFNSLRVDDSKLPFRVLFLIPAIHIQRAPIATLNKAGEIVLDNHYWCLERWQMNKSRRRLFLQRYKEDKFLQKIMYIDFPEKPKNNMVTDIYTWSWVSKNSVYELLLDLMDYIGVPCTDVV